MAKRRFWPGYEWRVLAHQVVRGRRGNSPGYTNARYDVRSGERWKKPHPAEGAVVWLPGDWEWDELVIDDWFHIEMMNSRSYWIGVGNEQGDYYHVNVHIDGDGRARVNVEKQ